MKLRQAKKILLNDYYDRCHYSKETLRKAVKKYQPYNKRDCAKKNKVLKEQGSSLRYMPYILKEYLPIINNSTIKPQKINTRYAKAEVNTDFYGHLIFDNKL